MAMAAFIGRHKVMKVFISEGKKVKGEHAITGAPQKITIC